MNISIKEQACNNKEKTVEHAARLLSLNKEKMVEYAARLLNFNRAIDRIVLSANQVEAGQGFTEEGLERFIDTLAGITLCAGRIEKAIDKMERRACD